ALVPILAPLAQRVARRRAREVLAVIDRRARVALVRLVRLIQIRPRHACVALRVRSRLALQLRHAPRHRRAHLAPIRRARRLVQLRALDPATPPRRTRGTASPWPAATAAPPPPPPPACTPRTAPPGPPPRSATSPRCTRGTASPTRSCTPPAPGSTPPPCTA